LDLASTRSQGAELSGADGAGLVPITCVHAIHRTHELLGKTLEGTKAQESTDRTI